MKNTFKYTRQLEEAGFSRSQAEIQLQIMTEMIEGDLATKQDLKVLESSLAHLVETQTNHLELKINNVENQLQQIEYRLTIKLGALLVIGFTSMATLLKFWLIR
jgi:hypothetical protein